MSPLTLMLVKGIQLRRICAARNRVLATKKVWRAQVWAHWIPVTSTGMTEAAFRNKKPRPKARLVASGAVMNQPRRMDVPA